MSEAWFARRFPVGHRSNAMAPASWAGWLVAFGFLALMGAGGVTFILVAHAYGIIAGAIAFAAIAAFAAGAFITLAVWKGDRTRTVEEITNKNA